MNVLRSLIGNVSKEKTSLWQASMAIQDEPAPGFIRQAQFGPAGVMLISGRARAFVPLRELFKLAEGNDERFRPPVGWSPHGPDAVVRRRAAMIRSGRRLKRQAK